MILTRLILRAIDLRRAVLRVESQPPSSSLELLRLKAAHLKVQRRILELTRRAAGCPRKAANA
jgi:hypothetical protein